MSIRILFILFSVNFILLSHAQEPDSLRTNEPVDTTVSGITEPVDTSSVTITEPADTTLKTVDDVVDEILASDSLEFQKIRIEFVKKKVEHSPDSAYFNVCKVTNTTSDVVSGSFLISVPVGWNLIGDPSTNITLNPGETKIFPVRTTLSSEAVGGMAYPIDASLTTNEGIFSGAAFVKIPLFNKWNMYVDRHTVYFNQYFDEQEFTVNLHNKGNADELIRLDFAIGKLLQIEGLQNTEIYVSVPAYTDTALVYRVKPALLNEDEIHAYKQMWNESLITIKAQSGLGQKYSESIRFRDLENEYVHERSERSSPLNVDLSVFNLLSTIRPRINASLFGEIQFRGDHDLSYIFQARNLFYNSYNFENYFQVANNATFNINYRWSDKIRAQLGEITNYSMHSLRGWGINGTYSFDKNSRINAAFIVGKYYPLTGGSARYDTRIKKVGVHIGATYEDNGLLHYEAISVQTGVNFPIAKNHLFRLSVLGTQSVLDLNSGIGDPNDTTALGFSYMASYTGMVNKFRFGLNTRNDQFNVLRIRPGHGISGYARYIINDRSRINVTGQFNSIQASRLLFNSFFDGSYNGQQIYRLTYSRRINNKVSFESGPSSRILNRFQLEDTTAAVISDFTNYFIGVYTLTRIRFDEFRMLTPTLSAGVTLFRDHLAEADTIPLMPTTNLGVSYVARSWGASANYIYGPNFFLTQSFFDTDITSFETIHFRGQYNRFISDRKVKFSAFGNYYLRLPSNRQSVAATARFDFFMPKGWKFFVAGNVFTNSVNTESSGVVTNRNFSLNFGVRKAFDIPQPRVKYHDLKVVCFNDVNGDGIRDENEPLLSNIKVKVSKNMDLADPNQARFGEQELVTSPEGSLSVIDIPEGQYTLHFESLENLGNLYNANGNDQDIVIGENTTIYVPYVESYRVRGKVILNRDEYSSLGLINANGIRVTATAINGDTYSALTDSEGNYLINIPQGGYYKIKVNNIFGEEFEIDRDEFLVQFDGFKSFNVDFTFYEKKRKVNFGGDNNFFNFESINESTEEGEEDEGGEE